MNQKQSVINKLERGVRGRFLGKKKSAENKITQEEKILAAADPIMLTFYGKTVRKFVVNGKSYFAIEDIMALGSPSDASYDQISFTDNFDAVKQVVMKNTSGLEVALAEGILKLIKEVVGVFPGPLERWLKEN